MIERSVREHLEILRLVPALRLLILEDVREAQTFDRRLGDATNMRRRFDSERLEDGRDHVDGVRELRANLACILDALRPVNDERIGHAATIGLALPALERRVTGVRPSPGVVVEIFRAAELIDRRQILLQIVRHVVEELVLVHRPIRSAFGTRAVVRNEHDQRIVEFAHLLEEIDQPPDVVIHVLAEAGEYFHHARIEFALVRRQLRPLLNVGVVTRELRVLGDDAKLFLPRECFFAIDVPALVELALVFVRPFLADVMRRMVRARREIKKERLVGGDLLQVGDEVDRLVGKIGGEVVALFRRLRRLDLMVVINEIGIILVRVAAEKAVIALEAAAQRPAVIGTGGADLLGRRQVPFADAIGRVTLLQKHLGQKAVLERYRAIAARKTGRPLGDAGHRIRVMVAPRQHA